MPETQTTELELKYAANADRIIRESLEGGGPLGDYFDKQEQQIRGRLTAENDRKKRKNLPGVVADEEIQKRTTEELNKLAYGDGKEPSNIKKALISSAKGETLNGNAMQSIIESAQAVGQLGDAKNALANFSILNPFGLINALVNLITKNDFVKAAIKAWFGPKDASSPKSFGEALAQVRSEKRFAELSQLTGANTKALFDEMNRPLETAAAPIAVTPAQQQAQIFNAPNGELPPPPVPTPPGNRTATAQRVAAT